MAIIEICGT